MFKRVMLALAIVALFAASSAYACGEQKAEAKKTSLKAEHVDFEGTLVCLGCSLKNTEGARSACKTEGHTHALKLADGRYVNFLANQYSKELTSGEKYHNKSVAVHGIYHASANLVDVETYSVDGQKSGWCSGCKSMDSCGMNKSTKTKATKAKAGI